MPSGYQVASTFSLCSIGFAQVSLPSPLTWAGLPICIGGGSPRRVQRYCRSKVHCTCAIPKHYAGLRASLDDRLCVFSQPCLRMAAKRFVVSHDGCHEKAGRDAGGCRESAQYHCADTNETGQPEGGEADHLAEEGAGSAGTIPEIVYAGGASWAFSACSTGPLTHWLASQVPSASMQQELNRFSTYKTALSVDFL